jgi:hypothetical protein
MPVGAATEGFSLASDGLASAAQAFRNIDD